MRFKNPQKARGVIGAASQIADHFLHIRSRRRPGPVPGAQPAAAGGRGRRARAPCSTTTSSTTNTSGFEEFAEHARSDLLGRRPHRHRADPRARSRRSATTSCAANGSSSAGRWASPSRSTACPPSGRSSTSCCCAATWAGPAAGACPVRGHSNVQGDRTMGIWEQMPDAFLDALEQRVRLRPAPRPRPRLGERHQGHARGPGQGLPRRRRQLRPRRPGQRPSPRTPCGAAASPPTSPPSSTGPTPSAARPRYPAHPRPHRTDTQAGGEQFVTVENSMSEVHTSHGRLKPASQLLLSEVAILCRLAAPHPRRPGGHSVGGVRGRLRHHPRPDLPRRARASHDFNRRVVRARRHQAAEPGQRGRLPHRHRQGRVHRQRVRDAARPRGPPAAADPALPRPVEHHPVHATTTATGASTDSRRVVMVNPARHGRARPGRKAAGRPGQRLGTTTSSAGRRTSRWSPYPTAPRLRRRVLPGDQCPGPAGQRRRHQQPADLQGHRGPAGAHRVGGTSVMRAGCPGEADGPVASRRAGPRSTARTHPRSRLPVRSRFSSKKSG